MRKGLFVVLALMTMVGCGNSSPEEKAAKTAKSYYELLIQGEYVSFLEGKYVPMASDSTIDLHADYYDQLLDGFRQFMAQQQENKKGIKEVRIVDAKKDSIDKCVNVFLMLCFGDSTKEEIVVPMVDEGERWLMR